MTNSTVVSAVIKSIYECSTQKELDEVKHRLVKDAQEHSHDWPEESRSTVREVIKLRENLFRMEANRKQ